MNENDDSMAMWYIALMDDFWSGRWNDSNAAFVAFAVFIAGLVGIPLFWHDITYIVWFAFAVVSQPIYGGAALIFFLRMVYRCRKK